MRPTVAEVMKPFHDQVYANPSGSHRFARDARRVIDEARDNVADVIGCRPGEIVFTSGGTEGANTAVLGTIRRRGGVAVCSSAEHHAVLHCVEHVGGRVLPVTETGVIDPIALRQTLREMSDVSLVSTMAVNNEVGSITDMQEVSRAVRRVFPEAVLHTDAVQSACWMDLRDIWPNVDVLTLSAHKFGGPKGVGIMVVREGVVLEPLLFGGGQERDRRSGTHNVAGIVGTATALRLTDNERVSEIRRIGLLRSRLLDGLEAAIDCAKRTMISDTVAGIAHVCLEGLENESLLYLLDEHGICASAASACASGAMEPSHVLAAMGVPLQRSKGALRFSLGHTTTESDIDITINAVAQAATRLLQAGQRKVTAQ
ncbi:MAG: cysteine desulfurase [Ilumatobacteraceae bacterium]|nr:cysteine desulfurase [Ilumatobacteraceae bacterium]